MNLRYSLGSVLLLGLCYSLDARAIPPECNDQQQLCSSDNGETGFCCDKAWLCLARSCGDPSAPLCNSGGLCGKPCTSNLDCNGLVCTYDDQPAVGICAPQVIEEKPDNFSCAVCPATSPNAITAWLACLALARRFRGRRQSQSEA